MQFRIASDVEDVAAVEGALRALDPAVVVDRAGPAGHVRVSTCLPLNELVDAVNRSGLAITRQQVAPVPSDCCGGCGG